MALSKNTATKKTQEPATTYEVKVTRAKRFDNGSVVYDLVVNGVSIYNCSYHEYQGKGFTSFPSRKGSDGKYYAHVYFKISDEQQKEIEAQVEELLK